MKKLIVFAFLFIKLQGIAQRAQLCFFIPFEAPNKTVMPQMRMPLSWGLSFGYRPSFNIPLLIELKSTFGSYGTKSFSNEVPLFANSQNTSVNTTFKSKFNTYMLGTKLIIGHEYRLIRAFATPQIGIGNFNSITKYDFTDPNGKSYSGRKSKNFNFNTLYGFELGTEIIINELLHKNNLQNRHRIALSFNLMRGFNEFQYANVSNSFDLNDQSSSQVELNDESYYIPLSHKYMYQDYYSELYKTKLTMWGIQIGYIINFDGSVQDDGE